MKPLIKILFVLLLLIAGPAAHAQGEQVVPVAFSPRPDSRVSLEKSGAAHEHYIYNFVSQEIPLLDDFSVDRIRHLNSEPGDPDVTLTETIYALSIGGVSTWDMAYSSDTTWHYTVDVTDPDNVVTTREANPSQFIDVRIVSAYPVPGPDNVEVWPPHTITDTIGDDDQDIIPLSPDLVQDSMLVYDVAADTRTYINPDNTVRPLILWEDDNVYINGGFPIDPPTVGVATLDGMDRTGFPYEPETPNNRGTADVLTSVPINLFYPASDSIYFSFFFQSLGNSGDGNQIDNDTLYVDFFMPDEPVGAQWQPVWSRKQTASAEFEQVMIPVLDWRYLRDGFRVRFRSRATLGGAVDQWHIDYVRLGRNRTYDDTELDDVAFLYPEQSLLLRYTSVPYVKYAAAPTAYMAPSITAKQRNLSTTDRFITWGYRSGPEGGPLADFTGGNNISNNAGTIFNSTFPVNSAPNNYVYDVSGSPEVARLHTKLWTQATPDGCRYNDTLSFVQELSNYYSYDDGTAEWGYRITGSDGPKRMAMRFTSDGGDSLRAVRLYFTPIFTYDQPVNDPRDGNFLITVWSSVQPENVIFQNISFSTPQYRQWGPNYFVEYALDSTIWVQGDFYVGLVQTNNVDIFVGLDRNRVNNDLMFYNPGAGWSGSGIQGSWMIRPVVVAAQDPFAGVESLRPDVLGIHPNPAGEAFRLDGADLEPGAFIDLLDATGRSVRRWRYDGSPFPVYDLAPGLYVVRASDRAGQLKATGRLMVQHG